MSRTYVLIISVVLAALLAPASVQATVDSRAGKCMVCHKAMSPGLYNQWLTSSHGRHNVTCMDCHGAKSEDLDGFMHEGAWIATLVTPKDCGRCHPKETAEVDSSYHATAGLILESGDAYLAHVGGGHPAAIAGCESCHGTKVQIDPSSPNKLAMQSWPNSGIGRLNPDGSKGACNACHTRHTFSKGQARQPEACSKCHLGPDHPQKEIYEASKHGSAYYTHVDAMNMDQDRWVVGVDYFEAPTCATCHMSATVTLPPTHDVGNRLKWNLRTPVSEHKEDGEQKRENMLKVCQACHSRQFSEGHFYQFDAVVRLYNEKFARPAGEIMAIVKLKKLLEVEAAFGNKLEWHYRELWRREGRRARHGAAMMGPTYTWWHGIYDVIHNFYFEFLEEARELHDPEVDAYIEKLLSQDPMHRWLSQSTDQLKEGIRSESQQEIYLRLFDEQ